MTAAAIYRTVGRNTKKTHPRPLQLRCIDDFLRVNLLVFPPTYIHILSYLALGTPFVLL